MRILLEASEQQAIHYNIASHTKTLWYYNIDNLNRHTYTHMHTNTHTKLLAEQTCHTGMIIIQRLYNSSMRFAYFMYQGNGEKQRGGGTEVLGKQTDD